MIKSKTDENKILTNRQTNRPTNRQTDKKDKQSDLQTERQTDMHVILKISYWLFPRLKIFSPEELNHRGASLPNHNNHSHHNEDHRNHHSAALSSDEEGKEREMSNREREEYHRILDKKRGNIKFFINKWNG